MANNRFVVLARELQVMASLKQCQRECSQKVINVQTEHAEMSAQIAEYYECAYRRQSFSSA